MQCSTCERPFNARRKRFCASCARATLYAGRIEQAAALLDREKSHTHVEAIVRPGNDGVLAALPEDADWDAITTGIKTHSWERTKVEIPLAEDKIRDIASKAEKLREQMQAYKEIVEKQRGTNERRRKELDAERILLDRHKNRELEVVQSALKKARHRLDKVHKRTLEAREHLCKEASSLSGLKRSKGEDGRSEYRLSYVLVPDLRDLNGINGRMKIEAIETTSGMKRLSEPHEVISASFDNICRFLGVCCHYLSIRLPAEIILPHSDFPHASILPRDSSYRTSNVRYPGTGSSQSASPVASRILPRSDLSRPRLLQLDRPLPQFQKEDSKAALFFLEGVVLLAYDIAWLCRSQGMDSISTFGDISAIGQNLHQLFLGKESRNTNRPPLNRNISTATTKTERSSATTATQTSSKPQLGMYSHSSAQHSLVSNSALNLFNPEIWPVSITRLSDQLKSYLRQETARAEWHIVDDTEWDEEMEEDRAVLIGGARRAMDPAMSVLSVKPSDGMDEAEFDLGRERGQRGWMKVRGRGGEE